MQTVGKWKRFRPRMRGKLDDKTVYEQDSIYLRSRQIVDDAMRKVRTRHIRPNSPLKKSSRAAVNHRARMLHTLEDNLALLILQAPQTVRAQREMDSRRGGYKNRQARLFELIDFNDSFVETVLLLPDEELEDFPERLKAEIDRFCTQLKVPTFTDQQYDAIVHGLSREIAVFHEAKKLGYVARMTSRAQDAMGVDIIITNPATKKSIGIDVKTQSSFHWRLVDLVRQNRIDEERRLECELAGFCTIRNGSGDRAVDTVLFRVATKKLGEIRNFRFVDSGPIAELLSNAMAHHGRYIV